MSSRTREILQLKDICECDSCCPRAPTLGLLRDRKANAKPAFEEVGIFSRTIFSAGSVSGSPFPTPLVICFFGQCCCRGGVSADLDLGVWELGGMQAETD